MRVVHVLCDLSGGGAERLVLDLCRHAPPEVDSAVVAVHGGGPLAGAFRAAGVPVRVAGLRRRRPGLRGLARLARWLGSAEVVHTHLWAGDVFGGAAALVHPGLPVVSTEHNTGGDGPRRDALRRLLARRAAVVAVSEAVAADARRRGVPVERVIENGVDLARFRPSPLPPGPPWRLLAVGRLVPQKGLDRLVEALARLPEEVVLEVAGEGPEGPALAARAGALGGRLRLLGFVEDVAGLYARAHLVVVPSRWEGFGLVAVEAMASGRPVLVSAVDALPSVVGEAGVAVEAGDPAALARAVGGLLGDPVLLRRLARRGPARAARFDVRRTAARYAALYRELRGAGRVR